MASTDSKISCIAFGFTIGFGYLTAWDAWKITAKHRSPLRSLFVWMVWCEIVVNLAIAIFAFLFLEGHIKPSVTTFFFMLFLWVFQIQFILQIIVNRVAIISMERRKMSLIRWGTVAAITLIQISVFCIFIPANMQVSQTYVKVNNIWDKITKFLILFIDCGLNYYFVTQVKSRLVRNGLQKYNALVQFNMRIIVISIGMDFLLIGTMFLKNGAVFMQFHPVVYIVKLKIELSMTNLITKIAQESVQERMATSSTNKRMTFGDERAHTRSIHLNSHLGSKGNSKSIFPDSINTKDHGAVVTLSGARPAHHYDHPDIKTPGLSTRVSTDKALPVFPTNADSNKIHVRTHLTHDTTDRLSDRSDATRESSRGNVEDFDAHNDRDDREILSWR
ncbi:hypothetical protein W97_05473 [Coniosporium apollinis CBS 100218]|uniref:Uncharacterized protein n=1 Tax=Coniosporium apollinis (strain CBS 100218) TaxID=1168221 RepID=R7YXH1_CONA1|nr:uncharacterized protein W97_05473 [Coniosporium apollinis CBS 100218]EON66376.1 hypothetical protein W97_05473 [Coniosporium apollinis CBS 100218]